MYEYNPKNIEKKWQDYWDKHRTFKTLEDLTKAKYYILDMFPYPSGAGLHVGHPEGYTASDIIARFKRMQGFNVLHPMGWDAFGLPAERAALRENLHPAIITKRNIANFKRQIKSLGLSYDWDREICTSDPNYYKWTQWLFLKMYERGLAYLADVAVNWCPAQGTVLANEEVLDGKYIETGDLVEKRVMRQWMLKITDYAEKLLAGLDELDWPQNVIDMQKNWIGKSVGANIKFKIANSNQELIVFTTRPETIYGVTFMVLAPDHPLLSDITTLAQRSQVEQYCAKLRNLSLREKEAQAGKIKTGVNTGALAIHPLTKKTIQLWVADYVKLDYGSGAIMAVPGHDQRDADFALNYHLPSVTVIDDKDCIINSEVINGLNYLIARDKIIDWLQQAGLGSAHTTYKLRDWLFSRQRYWGEPFPIVYDKANNIIPLGLAELPLELPELDQFKPTDNGNPPLARAVSWINARYQNQDVIRELNTMPQWAGSCWYYLRYMDPTNQNFLVSPEKEKYWGSVDLYIGGLEHAVSHLLYARFWHKVLFDCGIVSQPEPFKKLFNQGIILGISYRDEQGKYYYANEVLEQQGQFYSKQGKTLTSMVEKMSKSKLNVTNPDEIILQYGADALRLYEMFMGPLEAMKPWQTNGVKGVYNFLQKVWRASIDPISGEISSFISSDLAEDSNLQIVKELHRTIAKVTQDINNLKFNTAIAKMMECLNVFKSEAEIARTVWEKFILILSPFAPHLAEEIWSKLGYTDSLAYYSWPDYDSKYLTEDTVVIVVCINSKKIKTINIAKDLADDELIKLIMADPKVIAKLTDKDIIKTIIIPNKTVNLVVAK